jgi:hypothetical protein
MKHTFTQNGTEEKAQKTAHTMKYETIWCRHETKEKNKRI